MPWAHPERPTRRWLDVLLPRHCALCGSDACPQAICADCYGDLPWIDSACDICGTPLPAAGRDGVPCGACQQALPPFRGAFAPLHYRFPVDALIKAFKFGHRLGLAPMLAQTALPMLVQRGGDCDALLPVPLARWRHVTRGFNQAHELARQLHSASGLPICCAVRRVRHTAPQSGLAAADRRLNVRGAFRVVRRLRYRHPLVVDDVMTTGETCRELCETLLAAGVEQVSVLTIARASATGRTGGRAPGVVGGGDGG